MERRQTVTDSIKAGPAGHATDNSGGEAGFPGEAGATPEHDRISSLQLWLILGGFGMMFLASVLMWFRFGPTMFVDLATAVANCF